MTLYVLRHSKNIKIDGNNTFSIFTNQTFGFVIRAKSEEEARFIAYKKASGKRKLWLDKDFTDCSILEDTGESCIILEDYQNAG